MVPAEGCDGQEQARSTLNGHEVDLTKHSNVRKSIFGVNTLFTPPDKLVNRRLKRALISLSIYDVFVMSGELENL